MEEEGINTPRSVQQGAPAEPAVVFEQANACGLPPSSCGSAPVAMAGAACFSTSDSSLLRHLRSPGGPSEIL